MNEQTKSLMRCALADLIGPALDWAVAKAAGVRVEIGDGPTLTMKSDKDYWFPSTDWSQGGPIIERIVTKLEDYGDAWSAEGPDAPEQYGPTPLIAAMRCYVASKLGDEINVPEELL